MALAQEYDGQLILSDFVSQAFEAYVDESNSGPLKPVWLSERAAKELKGAGGNRSRYEALIERVSSRDSSTHAETKINAPGLLFAPKVHVAFYKQDEGIVVVAMWSQNLGYKDEIDNCGLRRGDHPPFEKWPI